jgi:hypothetical protein
LSSENVERLSFNCPQCSTPIEVPTPRRAESGERRSFGARVSESLDAGDVQFLLGLILFAIGLSLWNLPAGIGATGAVLMFSGFWDELSGFLVLVLRRRPPPPSSGSEAK